MTIVEGTVDWLLIESLLIFGVGTHFADSALSRYMTSAAVCHHLECLLD